jgi:hypothetical protein
VALQVSHPQLVGCRPLELALDQVSWPSGLWIAAGQPMPPAPMAALAASGAHQPGDPFAAHVDAQASAQLGVHARAP